MTHFSCQHSGIWTEKVQLRQCLLNCWPSHECPGACSVPFEGFTGLNPEAEPHIPNPDSARVLAQVSPNPLLPRGCVQVGQILQALLW